MLATVAPPTVADCRSVAQQRAIATRQVDEALAVLAKVRPNSLRAREADAWLREAMAWLDCPEAEVAAALREHGYRVPDAAEGGVA